MRIFIKSNIFFFSFSFLFFYSSEESSCIENYNKFNLLENLNNENNDNNIILQELEEKKLNLSSFSLGSDCRKELRNCNSNNLLVSSLLTFRNNGEERTQKVKIFPRTNKLRKSL